MKFSYSLIKKLLPQVPPAKILAQKLNSYAFEVEEVQGDMLEIKLPANQYSGASSHIGVARIAAAIFGLKFKDPVPSIINIPKDKGLVRVKIEDKKLCPRYSVRVFDLKKVGKSPASVQKILRTCGINPINSVVDIMNLVMLETGQPLHAFDAETLAPRGKEAKTIYVRHARKNEKFETLDNQNFELDPANLVIADSEKALAIAGIKGGKNSGVEKNTRRIIVEAANFDEVMIYKTSRQLKLSTDASVRFAHAISPALVEAGLNLATVYLKKEGAKLLDSADADTHSASDSIIDFDSDEYLQLVGAPVSIADARRYFQVLGFDPQLVMKKGKGVLKVRIPAWRNDIENFEDLAEEVVRLSGLNELPKAAPAVSLKSAAQDDTVTFRDRACDSLVRFQLDEVYNYSFLGERDLERFAGTHVLFPVDSKLAEIENPIAEDKKFMRPSLAPLLAKNILDNGRYFNSVRIFEVGKVFAKTHKGVEEKLALGIALGEKNEPRLILDLKGIIDQFLKELGVSNFFFKEEDGVLRVEADGRTLAQLQTLELPKGWNAAIGELNGDLLLSLIKEEYEFKPLPKFPAIARDVSVLVSKETRIGEIIEAMQQSGSADLEDVDLIDEYSDEKLEGKQSLTFRMIFQAEDRTLSDEEVNRLMEGILKSVRERFYAEIR